MTSLKADKRPNLCDNLSFKLGDLSGGIVAMRRVFSEDVEVTLLRHHRGSSVSGCHLLDKIEERLNFRKYFSNENFR
jgi:hypothetical protein